MKNKQVKTLKPGLFVLISGLFLIIPLRLFPWVDITESYTRNVDVWGWNRTVRFYVHEVGKDESNQLAYTFYLLADHHIGGLQGDEYDDYNLEGHEPSLLLSEPLVGLPDKRGGPPGDGLSGAVLAINDDYLERYQDGVENGEAVFTVDLGDLSVSAERAEQEHAKLKERNGVRLARLDSLIMPWLPVIGNHDTWPEANGSDNYFTEVFGSHINKSAEIFPNWERQSLISEDGITPQSWSFNMGPNHHAGLDFCARSNKGWYPYASISEGNPSSWDWFKGHLPDEIYHERLLIFAHHPFDELQFAGVPTQYTEVINFIEDNEPEDTYWFGGHEHPDPNWWGYPTYADRIITHCIGSTDRARTSEIPVALVKVYSDFVCDYTITPNPASKWQEVTFTSTSNYYAGSIVEYGWDFGDGDVYAGVSQSSITHMYGQPGTYWTKHWVKNSNGDYAYMVRPLKVTGCPKNPHLVVEIKEELPGPGGLMSYLGPPIKYKATLKCWFDITGSGATFHRYYGGREYPYVDHFVNDSWYGAFKIWHDPLDLQKHQRYDWKVYAEVTCDGESEPRSLGSNRVTKYPGGDTTTPGGCPEISVYYEDYPYLGDTIPFFLRNNTILPHSEHYPEIRTDLMTLDGLKADADHYYLNISENDNETSYIDEAKLWVVDHPEGTEVATSSNGDIYVYSDVADPLWCKDNNDEPCYEEIAYQDDEAFLGDNSSYITIAFPNTDWADKGLLLGTGMPSGGSESAPMPKNYLGIPKKPDGQGGWTPMGEAFARKESSLWMFDVSDVQDNTFCIDCSGDSCYINYIGLVKLEESGWTKTAMPLDSAVKWDHYEGTWYSNDATLPAYLIDSVYVEIHPNQQLALRFDTLATDTLVRDFVLQTSGFYVPDYVQGQGQPGSEEEKLVFKLEVQQIKPLTRDVSIRYTLSYSIKVKIAVYDVQGRLVNKLVDGEISTGEHEIRWNGTDNQGRSISAGIYFIKMNAGEFKKDKKIVVVK